MAIERLGDEAATNPKNRRSAKRTGAAAALAQATNFRIRFRILLQGFLRLPIRDLIRDV